MKKSSRVAQAFNPSAGASHQAGSWASMVTQTNLLSEFEASEKLTHNKWTVLKD